MKAYLKRVWEALVKFWRMLPKEVRVAAFIAASYGMADAITALEAVYRQCNLADSNSSLNKPGFRPKFDIKKGSNNKEGAANETDKHFERYGFLVGFYEQNIQDAPPSSEFPSSSCHHAKWESSSCSYFSGRFFSSHRTGLFCKHHTKGVEGY